MRLPNVKKFFRALLAFFKRPVVVPDTIALPRQTICRLCPNYDPVFAQCNLCTCFIGFKAIMATEECPERRWGQYYSPTNNGLPK
jgi:hypothetical protein